MTLELIEARGIGRLTTAALARRLGFTEAALYRYYSGKTAILAAVLQNVAESLFVSMADELAVGGDGSAPPVEQRLCAHAGRFTRHQGVLLDLLMFGTTGGAGELQEAGNAFLEEYLCRLASYFERAAAAGEIARDVEPQELAGMWVCQLLGGFMRSRLTRNAWDPVRLAGYRSFMVRLRAAAPGPA